MAEPEPAQGRLWQTNRDLLRIAVDKEYRMDTAPPDQPAFQLTGKWVRTGHFDLILKVNRPYLAMELSVSTKGMPAGSRFKNLLKTACVKRKSPPDPILDWLLEHADQTKVDPELLRGVVRVFIQGFREWLAGTAVEEGPELEGG
jgi:hypothetical protein